MAMRSALGRLPSPPEGADVTTAHLAEDIDAEEIKAAGEDEGCARSPSAATSPTFPQVGSGRGPTVIMQSARV